ncbi:MAG: MFS transporter [Verrucomicrobiota bacterium]
MSSTNEVNRDRLLWAGFVAILAAGVGFGIRGGIFDNWAGEYGFTGAQLGAIGGAGFIGFCFGIIIGGMVVDRIGYAALVIAAVVCHILSYFVTFGASSPDNAYQMLWWGMFIFAFANGILEAVSNPLVATLYPENRNHYLNILHASWPLGMILGALVGWFLDDKMGMHWKWQLALYLVPTVVYGAMFFGQKYPRSEASEKGVSYADMFKDVGLLGGAVVCALLGMFFESIIPVKFVGYGIGIALWIGLGVMTKFSMGSILLFVLFITHGLVGAVELGTDGWIQNITGNLFSSEAGKWLFIWTSTIMFALRFCAHFIEQKLGLSPIGLLLACSVIAAVGLFMSSTMTSLVVAFGALGLYAIGKTFFWPSMLAVASDRFPKTGGVAISLMGGIGMMSAGFLGTPGLGYLKDKYSSEDLQAANPALYEEYKAEEPSTFMNLESTAVYGLNGTKLEEAKGAESPTEDQKQVVASDQVGDRKTLKSDALIPATMAVIFLGMLLYFKSIGGYKPLTVEEAN